MKDLLEGFKLIRSDTRQSILREHEAILGKTADKRFQYGKVKSLLGVVRGCFLYLLNIVAFTLVGWFMLIGQITIGTAAATMGFIESFITPIQSIITDMSTIRSTAGLKEKVLDMLEWGSESETPTATTFSDAMIFDAVTVRYKDFRLDNFSYRFSKGEKIRHHWTQWVR